MNMIRTTLNDMGRINMYQSDRVIQAAQEAHLRTKTRSTRVYNNINRSITRRINQHYQDSAMN